VSAVSWDKTTRLGCPPPAATPCPTSATLGPANVVIQPNGRTDSKGISLEAKYRAAQKS
jgi:hypothetical protein